MIINSINFGHVHRNVSDGFLLVDVLEAILTQNESAYTHAVNYAKQLDKWVDSKEVFNLVSAYDIALQESINQQLKARLKASADERLVVYAFAPNDDKTALFSSLDPINESMTINEFKEFIGSLKLNIRDREQCSGALYKLALTGCKQVRVMNYV
jgi:hypothetical protein